uniref:Sugar transporter SWEET n=1 Tax=Plectus sambesii TaxID=2011161 RepID=A0A914XQK2_9BILA
MDQQPSLGMFPFLDMKLLDVLSFTAVTSTIGLFLCGIPICQEIRRRKTSDGTNPAPFLMGALSGFFWLRYGLLKGDNSVLIVNGIGIVSQVLYLLYFYSYTRVKTSINRQLAFITVCALGMLAYVHVLLPTPDVAIDHLGFMCMILNILTFAAPLAALRDVIRDRCCESLPLPLCIANLVVSVQWYFYGALLDDPYIKSPNIFGVFLALIQLSFFLVYPRKRMYFPK